VELDRYIEVSLYRDAQYNDIAVKQPKILLYRGEIKPKTEKNEIKTKLTKTKRTI